MLRGRYFRILWFFAGLILRVGWWDIYLPRFGGRERSRKTRADRYRKMAMDFRLLAVQMGGVMIKVGQFLSARLDVLPPEVTDELAGLQDEVRAESFEDIRRVVEKEFNRPLEDLYREFQETPMAAASIGQVHFARLKSPEGENEAGDSLVVVKIQRPNIGQIVDTDLAALRVVGTWLNLFSIIRKRANVPALIAEFSRSLYEEIDYLHEGKNAETFAANFKDRLEVCVPRVFWSHTTRRVLTLENVLSIKITDYDRIEEAGIDRVEVARRLFNTYLQQIFDDHFFHADPHPGNLFILPVGERLPGEKRPWKLVFVDFGMAGIITNTLVEALRELFIAVGTQDGVRIVHAYQMMGVLLPGADVELLERASSRAFERFWGKSTSELVELGHQEAMDFVHEFGELLYEMPFQIPENLILLGRSLAILSGMCTGLDPQFNVWTIVAPYADQLIAAESGGGLKLILKELTSSLTAMISLPKKAQNVLDKMESGRLDVRSSQIAESLRRLERSQRRIGGSFVFGALFLGSIQLFLAGYGGLALAAVILALVVLFFTLF